MGQHRKALEIYVFKMQDYGKAEEYVLTELLVGAPTRPVDI